MDNFLPDLSSLTKAPYTYRKIGSQYFVSTSLGTWLLLDKMEFEQFTNFKRNNSHISNALITKLKKHLFLYDLHDPTDKKRIYKLDRLKYDDISKGPGLFLIGVTRLCNFKCPYCHLSAPPLKGNLTQKINHRRVIEKIVQFILSTPNPNVTIEFQGGEPLLAFGFIKAFVEEVKKENKLIGKNINFCTTSNLTLITDDKIDFLLKENISVSGTIDGDKNSHDANRPFVSDKGSFDEVIKKFEMLRKRGLNIGILSIITKKSLGKAREIVDAMRNIGINSLCFNKIQKLGRAVDQENWDAFGISNQDFFSFWVETIEYIFELHRQGVLITERSFCLILEKLFFRNFNFLDWRNPGGAIIGAIGFDDEGYIYPSDEAREIESLRLGNVFEHSYEDIVNNPLSRNILHASILEGQICNYCAYKSICGLCPILSYKNTNEFHSRHHLSSNRCSLNMAMFDYIINTLITYPEKIQAALFAHKFVKEAPCV